MPSWLETLPLSRGKRDQHGSIHNSVEDEFWSSD